MGGDFNLALDVDKDKKGGLARTHKKSREVITNFFENLALIDAVLVTQRIYSRLHSFT